jgi:ectoine hydroxylase-related dioxygenase (phytanoyl-CoA dioxygenase family)
VPATSAHQAYRDCGYGVVRGVFGPDRIDALLREADRLHALGARVAATTEDGPVKWLVVPGPPAPVLRGVQYAYRISRVLDDLRTSPEIGAIIEPLIGPDATAVVNTLFWKPPGESDTAIAYHQDASFRKPPERYRNLATSFVQVGLALDPHGPGNGGMKMVEGSHLMGDLDIRRTSSVMTESPDAMDLGAYGLSRDSERDLVLEPGDVVFWHPHLLHGSPPNQSRVLNRRFLITGYMRSVDCDAGDPSFRGGRPCPWEQTADPVLTAWNVEPPSRARPGRASRPAPRPRRRSRRRGHSPIRRARR